jgi:conserved hypothetical protein
MKILYGVVGEGMGHAMRSRVILEYLISRGHEIEIMASGRAVSFLARHFAGVHRIHGLHMIYEENRVRRIKTLLANVFTGAAGLPRNIIRYFHLIAHFQPQAVISDFESWTYLYGQMHHLPILSVDNMQIINRCKLPEAVIRGHRAEFKLTRAFIKSKLPFCKQYFITTFFKPKIRKDRTRLFPPILRPEILGAKRRSGDHLLVYSTGEHNEGMLQVLAGIGLECRVYGARRDLEGEEVEGSLRFRPFSEAAFIDDLASCRAVIAGGGFTLMGEAVYLQKPMLAIPLSRQFEQVMNARYLKVQGYGACAERLDHSKTVEQFIQALPAYQAKLQRYSQNGNLDIFTAIDQWLERAERRHALKKRLGRFGL